MLVVGGEVDLAGQDLAVHPRAGRLRERHGLLDRSRAGDLIADYQDGRVGLEQGVRGPVQLGGRPGPAGRDRAQSLRGRLGLCQHDVEGEREEDWPRRRRQGHPERPAEVQRKRLGVRDLGGPLAELVGQGFQFAGEDRLADLEIRRVDAGGHDDRGAGHVRVVEVAEAVSRSRQGVEVDDAHGADGRVVIAVIAAGLGVAGGHPDGHVLVQSEHVLQVAIGDGLHDRELGRPGVAEDVLDPVALDGLDEELGAGGPAHRSSPGRRPVLSMAARGAG